MRLEAYRVALNAANSELDEIVAEIKKIQDRREQIEAVAEALMPLVEGLADVKIVGIDSAASESHPGQPHSEEISVERAGEATKEPLQFIAKQSSDPLQSVIDNAILGWIPKTA